MKNLKYEERSTKWGIYLFEDGRARGDLIEMFKSVNGLDEINCERNPVINTPTDRALTRAEMTL